MLRRRSVNDWYSKTPTNPERRSKVSSMDWYLDGDRRPSTRSPFTQCFSMGQESFGEPVKAAEGIHLAALFSAHSSCELLMLSLDPSSAGRLLEASQEWHRMLSMATRRGVVEAIAEAAAGATAG